MASVGLSVCVYGLSVCMYASACVAWPWDVLSGCGTFLVCEGVFNGLSGCVYCLSGCVVVSVSVVGLWNSLCGCAYGLSGTQLV